MWTPLPVVSVGPSSGRKLARRPSRRATSRTTSLSTTLRSAPARPSAGAIGISNWCGGELREEALRLHTRFLQGAHHAGRERAHPPLRLAARRAAPPAAPRAARTRARSSPAARAPELALEHVERLAQETPRAALPRAPVGLDDVAQQQLEAGRTPDPARTRVAGSGSRRRSPVEPNGFGSASGPSGVSAWSAGYPADAPAMLAASSSAASERPRTMRTEVAAHERDELDLAHARTTVPLSQMASRRPSPATASRVRSASAARDHDEHPALGHVAPLERRGQPLARLQVHAPVPERGVGVGDRVQVAGRPRHAADDDARSAPPASRARGPSWRRRRAGRTSSRLHARMRAPQVMGREVGDQRSPAARSRRAARTARRGSRRSTVRRAGARPAVPRRAPRSPPARPRRWCPTRPRRRSRGSPGGSRDGPFRRAAGSRGRSRSRSRRRAPRRPGPAARRRARRCPPPRSASEPQKAPHRSSRWGSSRSCSASSSRAPGSSVSCSVVCSVPATAIVARGSRAPAGQTLGDPGGVAVVEHQRVAVGVAEEGHVADAGVERVAVKAHALLFERLAGRFDVVDVQRDRVAGDVVLEAHFLGVDHAEREVAGLELGEVALGHVHRAPQAERRRRRTAPPARGRGSARAGNPPRCTSSSFVLICGPGLSVVG